ncbi:Aliphatic amidase [Sphingomonas antarctica]|uniref:nitrilase-related carbon-nitrogen hydrolase n=1 Tax=Sphingomonas antarctica TaxID=2040274 RepID=UPI0039EBE277
MTYAAVAMQMTARSVAPGATRDTQRESMLRHLTDVTGQIRGATAFITQYGGAPVRLAVLPEYLFTSYPIRTGISAFAEVAAWDMRGPEYDALGKAAQDLNLFLAGNAYERDPHFPGLYFQTSFIVAPSGEIVLRYRRINSMFAPTPHDVWSKYLDIYGLDGVFPVARTEIGNLAAIASEEILYPEIARAHALRGAEIFVHSSSEIGGPRRTHKMIAKQARAFENLAYVVSANTAGIDGYASADGNSMVVDWKGQVLAEAGAGETYTAFADIDLDGLRTARRKPGMTNYLARQRTEVFAAAYAAATVHPAGSLLDGDIARVPDRAHFIETQESIISRLAKEGLI